MRKANRPDMEDKRPKGVLFSSEGSSGWQRRRDIRNYKPQGQTEADFSDQHDRFFDPGSDEE